MIKEAIDRIITLAAPHYKEQEKLTYSDKKLELIVPPQAGTLEISTLQGLADLVTENFDDLPKGDVIARVKDSTTVELLSRVADDYGRRRCWVRATYPALVKVFPFGTWLAAENFIILCQAGFQRVKIETGDDEFAKDLDYVLKIASDISTEAIQTSEDDGISQKISTKRGVVLKSQETIKPLITLAPRRTFAEIDQPISQFVFRARIQDGNAHLAIFEADGGRWHLFAVRAIAEWLTGKLGDVPIIS
jgi:hypothetical protein